MLNITFNWFPKHIVQIVILGSFGGVLKLMVFIRWPEGSFLGCIQTLNACTTVIKNKYTGTQGPIVPTSLSLVPYLVQSFCFCMQLKKTPHQHLVNHFLTNHSKFLGCLSNNRFHLFGKTDMWKWSVYMYIHPLILNDWWCVGLNEQHLTAGSTTDDHIPSQENPSNTQTLRSSLLLITLHRTTLTNAVCCLKQWYKTVLQIHHPTSGQTTSTPAQSPNRADASPHLWQNDPARLFCTPVYSILQQLGHALKLL